MATFQIEIPDELVPGIIATAIAEQVTQQEVINAFAASAANKVCQDMKVGPYFEGVILPRFNADGTPYGTS